MTKMEMWTNEQSKRFKGTWDYTCVSNDSFQNGFNKFKQELTSAIITGNNDLNLNKELREKFINLINSLGKDNVDVEFNNGSHQLK